MPGIASGVYGVPFCCGGGVETGANSIQSRFWPSPAKVSRKTCVPAPSVTGTPTSWNVANDPVFGTAIVATVVPSTETATVRPLFGLATRAVMVYAPAVVTFTV